MKKVAVIVTVFIVFFLLGRLAMTIYDAGHKPPTEQEWTVPKKIENTVPPAQQQFEQTHEQKG